MSLLDDKQADIIDAFNTTFIYLDDILNIDNVYFDTMISQIYPSELQLNKANTSDTEFYGDLVYKLKKIVGSYNFSAQFIKIISHYINIGYNINVLQQTANLVINPITVGNFAFLFNCMPVGRTSDSMTVQT